MRSGTEVTDWSTTLGHIRRVYPQAARPRRESCQDPTKQVCNSRGPYSHAPRRMGLNWGATLLGREKTSTVTAVNATVSTLFPATQPPRGRPTKPQRSNSISPSTTRTIHGESAAVTKTNVRPAARGKILIAQEGKTTSWMPCPLRKPRSARGNVT